jgi:hypothetical protein
MYEQRRFTNLQQQSRQRIGRLIPDFYNHAARLSALWSDPEVRDRDGVISEADLVLPDCAGDSRPVRRDRSRETQAAHSKGKFLPARRV